MMNHFGLRKGLEPSGLQPRPDGGEEPSQGPKLLLDFKHNIPSRLLLLYTFYQKEKESESGEEMEKEEEGKKIHPLLLWL